MTKFFAVVLVLFAMGASAEYNVRMPSTAARPRWSGAKPGEWTMDYEAAFTQAAAEGKNVLLLTTGSWWCPHCEAFEEKVLVDHATQWRNYIQDQGFYLVMLDFPYRGKVSDAELWKSKYPEYGNGWGFQCWLYDEDYLAENWLSREDGLNAIMDLYRLQKKLALPSAQQVTIKTWDGSEDFVYGKVGYPTLIVFRPDGVEAGRFSPGATGRESDDAYNYVVEKIDSILKVSRDEECGLCSDPEEWGLSGNHAEKFRAWISDASKQIIGTVEFKTSRKDFKHDIDISAVAVIAGKKFRFEGVGHDCCIDVVTLEGDGESRFELMFGEDGVKGRFIDGELVCTVKGARDVFASRDETAKLRRNLLVPGTWTFAMAVTNTPSEEARGYGSFTVKVGKSGTASLNGTLPDGTSVAASSKAIIGDSEVYCIPFSIDKRKGGFGCCLWFKNGWLFNITDIREWTVFGILGYSAGWRAIYSANSGFGEVKDELELVMPVIPQYLAGYPTVIDPNGDVVTVSKNRWTGTEQSQLRANMGSKNGLVSGTMRFYTQRANGVVRSNFCKVVGRLIDGTAYCTVITRKDGTFQMKVSSCNACED